MGCTALCGTSTSVRSQRLGNSPEPELCPVDLTHFTSEDAQCRQLATYLFHYRSVIGLARSDEAKAVIGRAFDDWPWRLTQQTDAGAAYIQILWKEQEVVKKVTGKKGKEVVEDGKPTVEEPEAETSKPENATPTTTTTTTTTITATNNTNNNPDGDGTSPTTLKEGEISEERNDEDAAGPSIPQTTQQSPPPEPEREYRPHPTRSRPGNETACVLDGHCGIYVSTLWWLRRVYVIREIQCLDPVWFDEAENRLMLMPVDSAPVIAPLPLPVQDVIRNLTALPPQPGRLVRLAADGQQAWCLYHSVLALELGDEYHGKTQEERNEAVKDFLRTLRDLADAIVAADDGPEEKWKGLDWELLRGSAETQREDLAEALVGSDDEIRGDVTQVPLLAALTTHSVIVLGRQGRRFYVTTAIRHEKSDEVYILLWSMAHFEPVAWVREDELTIQGRYSVEEWIGLFDWYEDQKVQCKDIDPVLGAALPVALDGKADDQSQKDVSSADDPPDDGGMAAKSV